MENEINKRIKSILKKEKITQKAFCEQIEVSEHTFKTTNSRDSYFRADTLAKIAMRYPQYSIRWILTGEDDIESNANSDIYSMDSLTIACEPEEKYGNQKDFRALPVYRMDTTLDSTIVEYIPFIDAKQGDICIKVTGNGMAPIFPSGCYVQIRNINNWSKFIEYGQVYIIDLKDNRRLIKEIHKASNKKYLKLISKNEKFDEVEISTNSISKLWLVLAKYEKIVM